jgi:adenosylcobinamide-GDP ribazoletransferase
LPKQAFRPHHEQGFALVKKAFVAVESAFAAIGSAFAYFSIAPSSSRSKKEMPNSGAIAALPLVGLVIGAIAGATGYGVSLITTQWLGYAAAFIATIVLTGALHIDGFLDSCDAVCASVEPQRRLEILKDPRHGTYAVAGMSILTVAWIAALSGFTPQKLALVLAFSGGLARAAAIFPMFFSAYARPTPSSALARPPSKFAFLLWLAITLAGSFLIGHWAWVAIPVVLGINYLAARWMAARLGGGLTGDSYGFLIAVGEPLVLFLLDIRV